jgi:hypothetical protein
MDGRRRPMAWTRERVRGISAPDDLLRLYDDLESGAAGEPSTRGLLFEDLVIKAFELESAQVRWSFDVTQQGDVVEQMDGAVYVDHLAAIVEAKHWSTPVNVAPIARLRSQLLNRPAQVIGVVFSRQGFTEPAKALTRMMFPQTVLLWEGSELREAVQKGQVCEGLRVKYRYAVEESVPDYNLNLKVEG